MEDINETTEIVARGGREMRGMPEDFNGEMPEGFDGELPEDFDSSEMGVPPEWRRDGEMPMLISGHGEIACSDCYRQDCILHPVGYLALGGCSVILGIIISYACFSRCFHLKPGQTFSSLKKFIWFIVVAVVVAVLLMTLCYFVPVWASA